jgi:NAD(P)-dependent dehydrogenase (short-subunit alcohol dehydrogenase family)
MGMKMAQNAARRWFITGVSTGFGRVLALELVRRGEKVAGTVRKPEQVAALEEAGIAAILLDVNDAERAAPAVAEAIARIGGIDVLVNNAGYGLMAAIEALTDDEIRAIMETNFFGALRVTRAALPELRSHGGAIISISSMAGIVGISGAGAYCASKFALEGLTESLAHELAPFGVKVMIVEPSSFRTDFHGRSMHTTPTVIDGYAGTQAGDINKLLVNYDGNEKGDPQKGVKAILDALDSPDMPLRLVLGADAVAAIEAKTAVVQKEVAAWKQVALATAFDS